MNFAENLLSVVQDVVQSFQRNDKHAWSALVTGSFSVNQKNDKMRFIRFLNYTNIRVEFSATERMLFWSIEATSQNRSLVDTRTY